MTIVVKNRIKTTTTTTGIGTLSLNSQADIGYQNFSAIGNSNQTYYLIVDGTAWESGLGTYQSAGNTLSRDLVFDSSNGGSLLNLTAGTKTVLCGLPSAATSGSLPTADNNSIDQNLSAWRGLQALMMTGVQGEVAFDNQGVGGIVSTYSLVYTRSSAYQGGVLAPDGDIHFIPGSANRGQKINTITGIVSTYSLVYTGSYSYIGGVLAPNGDIHFVPSVADRGQKINTITGVVSTYSLAYTTPAAYYGGVLAPNGDIHFVPTYADRGQKIITNTSLPLAVCASPFFNKL